MLKLIKRFLNATPAQRTWAKLCLKYGKVKRFTQTNVRWNDIELEVPDVASFLAQYKEIFVHEIYRFRSTNDSPVILDCGSNIGMSCLYIKSIFPKAKITAFEADPKIAAILKGNLQRNRFSDVNVIQSAVWIENGTITFHSEGADAGSLNAGDAKSTAVTVPCVAMKDILAQHPHVDFLKFDIEGAELDVLQSCRSELGRVEMMFVEYHSLTNQPQRLDEVLKLIQEAGFRYHIHSIVDRKSPYINHPEPDSQFDVQLNIFCFRP